MTFLQTISQFIDRHALLRRDGFYLVALSGGADSVSLLHALSALNYKIEAVHCNFHLRGEESNRDEKFCSSLCQSMGVALHLAHFDTTAYAELHRVSIEMAARELRYRYFEQLRSDLGADGICVAHHSDDQVETVLLNLVRGTGLTGLQGMRPRNGYVLRPMLGVSRSDVLRYLKEMGQDYVTDSTNLEDDAMRNRLRHNVIPLLEEINPAARENICRMTENLAEASKVVAATMQKNKEAVTLDDGSIDLEALAALPSPLYALWTMLQPYGFNRTQVEEIFAHDTGSATWAASEYVAVAERKTLIVIDKALWTFEPPTLRLPEPGLYGFDAIVPKADGKAFELCRRQIRIEEKAVDADFQISKVANTATLDADGVRLPLTLRPVQTADRMMPFGMRGTKLVSDLLANAKVPALQRRHQMVVEDADGHIVWLVGRRVDQRAAIVLGRTQRALIITLM